MSIPGLVFAGAGVAGPIPPQSADVQTWRDAQGEEFYCWADSNQYWINLPGLASFTFERWGTTVTAFLAPSAHAEVVQDIYQRSVLPQVLQALGAEVLHASAVLGSGGVVALCGVSGSGKSTLAYALSRRGYTLAGDDAVAFALLRGRPSVMPLPFRPRLRPPAAAFFGIRPSASANGKVAASRAAPLAATFVLSRVNGSGREVVMRRLPHAAALATLLTHAHCFSLQEAQRKRLMMEQYLVLIAQVPVFEVRFHPGLENLPTILDTVEKTMRAHAGP